MNLTKIKKGLFILIIVIFILCSFEILSWIFFSFKKDRFFLKVPSRYILSDSVINKLTKVFDPNLGWKPKFKTKFGERQSNIIYSENLISAFGASYVFCDKVEDNQTWEACLSELLKKNVINFGVPAYGPDQSFLRFKEDYPKVNTKFVIIGFDTENINRIVNIYRKFYSPTTGIPLTKPRFVMKKEGLILLENPIKSVNALQNLKDENFINKIGRADYWYNRFPNFDFPYFLIFFNKNILSQIKHELAGDEIDPYTHLWRDKEIFSLLSAVIDLFYSEVIKTGAIPVICIFPLEHEIDKKIEEGRNTYNFQLVVRLCENKGYNFFCPIDEIIAEIKLNPNIKVFLSGTHYTPEGNKIYAKYLYSYIQKLQSKTIKNNVMFKCK